MTCSLRSKIQGVRRSSAEFHVGIQGKHSSSVVFSGTEITEGRKYYYVEEKKVDGVCVSHQCLGESTFIDRLKSRKTPLGCVETCGLT